MGKEADWIKIAMGKKGKFNALTIGQLRELEAEYPDIKEGEKGHMPRVYDRLAFTYSKILGNSGIDVSMDDIYELPSNHKLSTMLVEFMTGAVPEGNAGGSESTGPAEKDSTGSPQK